MESFKEKVRMNKIANAARRQEAFEAESKAKFEAERHKQDLEQ